MIQIFSQKIFCIPLSAAGVIPRSWQFPCHGPRALLLRPPADGSKASTVKLLTVELPATVAWIVMRRTGMSYRQIGEASGVDHVTVMNTVKESTGENSPVDLPATVVGKDGKERAATKSKTQTLRTSTAANLAISTGDGGNKRLKPSLYIPGVVKTGIFETTTAYNQKLGAPSLRVGQLFPASEASA